MTTATKLSPRQQRFVEEFLVDLNGTQAAIRAGYAGGQSAEVQAARLLGNAKVQAALAVLQKKLSDKLEITAERVLREYAKLGFANMEDYMRVTSAGDPFVDLSALTREQAAAISEITVEDFKEGRGEDARDVRRVKFKLHDKKGALDSIAKHLGMFIERVESEITHRSVISDAPIPEDEWERQYSLDQEPRGPLN